MRVALVYRVLCSTKWVSMVNVKKMNRLQIRKDKIVTGHLLSLKSAWISLKACQIRARMHSSRPKRNKSQWPSRFPKVLKTVKLMRCVQVRTQVQRWTLIKYSLSKSIRHPISKASTRTQCRLQGASRHSLSCLKQTLCATATPSSAFSLKKYKFKRVNRALNALNCLLQHSKSSRDSFGK